MKYLYAGVDFTYFQSELKSVGGISMSSLVPGSSNEINSCNGFATVGLAFDAGERFHLMLGGGVGAGIFDVSASAPGLGSASDSSDTQFMYKLELLAQFDVIEDISIGFGYKYVAAGDDIDTDISGIKIEDVATNVFTLSLAYRF